MPGRVGGAKLINGEELTPRQIVEELDKYIIGQDKAKKAVAIALRNRIRRQRLSPEMAEEVAPKNIIMMGATGIGKTEIARRLAKLARSPFLKVEASKFTEVGYVGRDVDSMIRDLTEIAVKLVKEEEVERVRDKAKGIVEERLLDILFPHRRRERQDVEPAEVEEEHRQRTREKLRDQLRKGALDDREIPVEVQTKAFPHVNILSQAGMEEIDFTNLKEMLPGFFPSQTKKKMLKVNEAAELLTREEEQKLIDMDRVSKDAIERVEQSGIIFLDEIDKIAGRESAHGPDVSREGVQRDILPIIEGTTVQTKYGLVRTDHILFIAAGAFHVSKPSDLIPELQGRFPIRVELENLGKAEFVRILREPKNALTKQYHALLETEGIEIVYGDDALEAIAEYAARVNERTLNIGARRLHTIMEKVLEEISFGAPEMEPQRITIDAAYVEKALADIVKDEDLSKYIL